MDPVIHESAYRHGVEADDMLHAYRNPIRVAVRDEYVMIIAGDRSGRLLEIGVTTAEGVVFIFHAMPARRRFLEG